MPARQTRRLLTCSAVIVSMTLSTLVACSGDSDRSVITVYAASSLTDIMQQVEQRYEQEHPGIDIRVNVAGTNTLTRQLNDGAGADLFVAADVSTFEQLLDSPVDGPHILAANTLTMVVPTANSAGITRPSDVSDPQTLTARCAAGVPCGDATDRYLELTNLTVGRSTDEPNVRSVLAKVSADEVDAGFVYRSDLHAAIGVTEVPLTHAPQVTVGLVQLSTRAEVTALTDLLRSHHMAEVLSNLGFEPVDSGQR